MMRNVKKRFIGVIAILLVVSSGVWAEPQIQCSSAAISANADDLGFDPDDYDFLVYDCGEHSIITAMSQLEIPFTLRDSDNPVTAQDLVDYDILIVGWNSGGDITGLSKEVIKNGITGRVILTGHDTDWHTANFTPHDAVEGFDIADVFLAQKIKYVLDGGGTGMISMADSTSGFDWLPDIWEISVDDEVTAGEIVSAITAEGYASGVYDNLDADLMSEWDTSYHNSFTRWGQGFVPWEVRYETGTEIIDYVITVAASVSPAEAIELTKTYTIIDHNGTGTGCADPDDELIYDISWDNIDSRTFEDVTIVDFLPYGVDYDFAADPFNPDLNYNSENHTYTWDIGTLDPNNLTGCVSLTVTVNEHAPAGMFLHNKAYIYSGNFIISIAEVDTPVCCWQTEDADIIYVDASAAGFNTGTSWDHAYTDLQDALTRAREAGCSATGYKIYAAEGTYKPGRSMTASFELPDGTEVYGGFKRGGCGFEERNPDKYLTILSGEIDIAIEELNNEVVVTMGDDCVLDGFVVEFADDYAVYGENVDCEVSNCKILRSDYGLRFINGNIDLNWNKVSYNKLDGIYHSGVYKELAISNCISSFNGQNGIFADNSTFTMKNSVITKNSNNDEYSYGINIFDPNEPPVLYNNTIAYNSNEGISYVKSDPNAFADVQGCILYYNNDNNEQMSGIEWPEYCCIQDSVNDPSGIDYIDYGDGNFSGKPMFAYADNDPNYCHLAHNSPLKDRGGLTAVELGTVDIDNEDRVVDGFADVGADEIYSCDGTLSEDDIYNERDWNNDGIVNLKEFALMSHAWLANSPDTPGYDPISDPNFVDNWNEVCNLYVDYTIDILDLALFTPEWLWTACWKDSLDSRFENVAAPLGGETMMMAPMSMSLESSVSLASVEEVSIDEQAERENMAMLVLGIYQIMDMMEESKYNPGTEFAIENVDAEIEKLEEILNDMYDDYYSTDKKTKIYKKR